MIIESPHSFFPITLTTVYTMTYIRLELSGTEVRLYASICCRECLIIYKVGGGTGQRKFPIILDLLWTRLTWKPLKIPETERYFNTQSKICCSPLKMSKILYPFMDRRISPALLKCHPQPIDRQAFIKMYALYVLHFPTKRDHVFSSSLHIDKTRWTKNNDHFRIF